MCVRRRTCHPSRVVCSFMRWRFVASVTIAASVTTADVLSVWCALSCPPSPPGQCRALSLNPPNPTQRSALSMSPLCRVSPTSVVRASAQLNGAHILLTAVALYLYMCLMLVAVTPVNTDSQRDCIDEYLAASRAMVYGMTGSDNDGERLSVTPPRLTMRQICARQGYRPPGLVGFSSRNRDGWSWSWNSYTKSGRWIPPATGGVRRPDPPPLRRS